MAVEMVFPPSVPAAHGLHTLLPLAAFAGRETGGQGLEAGLENVEGIVIMWRTGRKVNTVGGGRVQ